MCTITDHTYNRQTLLFWKLKQQMNTHRSPLCHSCQGQGEGVSYVLYTIPAALPIYILTLNENEQAYELVIGYVCRTKDHISEVTCICAFKKKQIQCGHHINMDHIILEHLLEISSWNYEQITLARNSEKTS